jgi:hypothetical protein
MRGHQNRLSLSLISGADPNAYEVCNDICKATVVMINLADAVYRDNMLWTQTARGHASLVWRYSGTCTKSDLTNDANFMLIEMVDSLSDDHDLTRTTQQQGYPCYGCFRNPAMTYVQRLRIITAARALVQRAGNIGYTSGNAVLPQAWNGHLDEITTKIRVTSRQATNRINDGGG